jgi:hypothetical protein
MQNPDEMMNAAITAFQLWRENKKGRSVQTPAVLRQQAVALRKYFSSSKITSALNISGSNIKSWSKPVQDKQGQPEFITLPSVDAALTAPIPAPLNLQITFANGCHMQLCGDISPAQLTAITQSVVAPLKAAS